jgi:hypothetical protein
LKGRMISKASTFLMKAMISLTMMKIFKKYLAWADNSF